MEDVIKLIADLTEAITAEPEIANIY